MTEKFVQEIEGAHSAYRLYEFEVSEGVFFRYTDADEDVYYLGNAFRSVPITISATEDDGTLKKVSTKVKLPYTTKIAKVLRVDPPSYVTTIKVLEGDFSSGLEEVSLVWQGRVLNSKTEPPETELECQPASTSLRRPGLRRHYQRPCPHALYGPLCQAVKADQPVELVEFSGGVWVLTLPSSGYLGAETYEGGLVSWVDEDGLQRKQTILRAVEVSGSLQITVNKALAPQGAFTDLTVRKGCNHTETACSTWHNNIQNYGGCPFIPLDTPLNKLSTYY